MNMARCDTCVSPAEKQKPANAMNQNHIASPHLTHPHSPLHWAALGLTIKRNDRDRWLDGFSCIQKSRSSHLHTAIPLPHTYSEETCSQHMSGSMAFCYRNSIPISP